MLPFLLQNFILRNGRRRRRNRANTFLRIYGIISSLALISLGGFRVTRSRINLELSPLGERRVRNQELVILRKKEKKKDMTYKSTENKENKSQKI
jgi:hypothetical protein